VPANLQASTIIINHKNVACIKFTETVRRL
jgi:hypothetical protein